MAHFQLPWNVQIVLSSEEARQTNKAVPNYCKVGWSVSEGVFVAAIVDEDLIGRRANPCDRDATGRSSLHLAAKNGHNGVAHLLLRQSAQVNATDNQRINALHVACQHGHAAIASLLVGSKADLHHQNANGEIALYMAAASGHERSAEVTRVLLDADGGIETCSTARPSPLRGAALHDDSASRTVASLLLTHKLKQIEVRKVTQHLRYPLQRAKSSNLDLSLQRLPDFTGVTISIFLRVTSALRFSLICLLQGKYLRASSGRNRQHRTVY